MAAQNLYGYCLIITRAEIDEQLAKICILHTGQSYWETTQKCDWNLATTVPQPQLMYFNKKSEIKPTGNGRDIITKHMMPLNLKSFTSQATMKRSMHNKTIKEHKK